MVLIIINLTDLKDQFGDDRFNGLKSYTQILREVELTAIAHNRPDVITIDCNERSDAICIFKHLQAKNPDNVAFYEYQGTAN